MQLLAGTSLGAACASKLMSLQGEYNLLQKSASQTRWFRLVADHLTFKDWIDVDAMYRSRALDFPEIGHCMVPCLDLANHEPGEKTVAVYEKDDEGNALLLLREGKMVPVNGEVTITYGDDKGACEMLFSYGFLDGEQLNSATTLFLSLGGVVGADLARAIMDSAKCAPGFKLVDIHDDQVNWIGDHVWFLSVNSDDGLGFEVARTTDGEEEVHAFFQGQEIAGGAAQLRSILAATELWDVYRLRAITILQQRIFDELQVLYAGQDAAEATPHGDGTEVRETQYQQAMELRRLEFDLMNKAYEQFENEVSGCLCNIIALLPAVVYLFGGVRARGLDRRATPSIIYSCSTRRCGLDGANKHALYRKRSLQRHPSCSDTWRR